MTFNGCWGKERAGNDTGKRERNLRVCQCTETNEVIKTVDRAESRTGRVTRTGQCPLRRGRAGRQGRWKGVAHGHPLQEAGLQHRSETG